MTWIPPLGQIALGGTIFIWSLGRDPGDGVDGGVELPQTQPNCAPNKLEARG
jgi:hypothetical protein